MRLTHSTARRAVTGLAAGLLVGSLLIAAPAGAAPVTPGDASVRAATTDLDASARIAGTAWAFDKATGQVVVTADETVTGVKLQQLVAVTRRHAKSVRLRRTAGTLGIVPYGGAAIWTSGARCSLGFSVVDRAGQRFFLTAGHCTNLGSYWSEFPSGGAIGVTTGSSFPVNDYGIVRYTVPTTGTGGVWRYPGFQDITSAANVQVGQPVCRSGSTTGLHCGTVTAIDATVNYPQGTVFGMIQTNICAEPGDSGGPLFNGSVALGLTSGASGNCTMGGTTYYQPVTKALAAYGVNVY